MSENKMNSTVRIPASILWRRSPAKCSALLRVTWQSLVLVEVVKVGISSKFNAFRHLNSRRDSRYFPRASWLPGCHGRPSVLAGGLQGRVHHLEWEIRIKTLTMYWLAGLWRSGSDQFHVLSSFLMQISDLHWLWGTLTEGQLACRLRPLRSPHDQVGLA